MIRRSILGLLVLTAAMGSSALFADEYYYGGVTVDIDRDVPGYLWIDDATVNLYKNAHIKNDYYLGEVYVTSGAIVNIYGGQIDNLMMISTMYNGLPEAVVTVYGTDFAVNGVPVAAGTPEIFMQGETLSGIYEDGTPFAYVVECFQEGDLTLMLHLNWLDMVPEEPTFPDIEFLPAAVEFGEVTLGQHALQFASIANAGDAALTVVSVSLADETMQFFLSGVQLPAVLEPNETLQVGLVYVPAEAASAGAVLTVVSDDPDEQALQVVLSGAGVVELTALERMDAILAFFDQSVEEGTIAGAGNRWNAGKKLDAFGHLLKTARYLVEHEYYAYAACALHAADLKSDGQSCPEDFVKGGGVAELNDGITELEGILKTL